jgi:hypothetical protein
MAVHEALFPDLVSTGYQVTSPPDPVYNCIAWAAGRTTEWWWPDRGRFEYWPPGAARDETVAAFVAAFATLGYVCCADGALEPGWEKVAIYATVAGPTHMARQLPNGRWTSKLGPDDDIEHSLEGLVSPVYGAVVPFLRRPAPHP